MYIPLEVRTSDPSLYKLLSLTNLKSIVDSQSLQRVDLEHARHEVAPVFGALRVVRCAAREQVVWYELLPGGSLYLGEGYRQYQEPTEYLFSSGIRIVPNTDLTFG